MKTHKHPTQAAMRAAEVIGIKLSIRQKHDKEWARIIDKETKLPQLIAAAQEAVAGCGCSARLRDSGHRTDCFAPRLEAVLNSVCEEAI